MGGFLGCKGVGGINDEAPQGHAKLGTSGVGFEKKQNHVIGSGLDRKSKKEKAGGLSEVSAKKKEKREMNPAWKYFKKEKRGGVCFE